MLVEGYLKKKMTKEEARAKAYDDMLKIHRERK